MIIDSGMLKQEWDNEKFFALQNQTALLERHHAADV